jgi:hypothetical protein
LRRALYSIVVGTLLVGLIVHSLKHGWWSKRAGQHFHWHDFRRLDGIYSGVRNLVPYADYQAQNGYNVSEPLRADKKATSKIPPLDPVTYDPYPDSTTLDQHSGHGKVSKCFLDEGDSIPVPDIYAYPALPQHLPQPFYGSYSELGIREDVCFDRYGRYGPYGYSYDENAREHGLRALPKDDDFKKLAGVKAEKTGSEKVFEQAGYVNWTGMDWGDAQRRCYAKNKARFGDDDAVTEESRIPRHAYVLRTWTGYKYDQHSIFALRAMISELSLKTGGEYDVHLLVHSKNKSAPIFADKSVYDQTLQAAVPKEFWNISTLWSEEQMKMYYPGPYVENFANMAESTTHGAYRSPHFALQWFSQQHPEYDFFWNWEMDLRYTGHYYELNSKISEWAKKQPRKGLWERSRRFWIPKYHGDYQNFTKFVEEETNGVDKANSDAKRSGPVPIWGPVQNFKNLGMLPPPANTTPTTTYAQDSYEWGVGEDADLITFNPIFDPTRTNWVFRNDVTGYNTSLPIPPRRAAIVTVARLSRRLLNTMHEEVWSKKHTMFPEMWAPSVCMHHGLKAVYAPHPVYFEHDWNLATMDQTFNYPKSIEASPFGWGENNLLSSTFYYNSVFAGALWRRWLGMQWLGEGGRKKEEAGTGRMCLRGLLLHPVKYETGDPA